MRTTMADLPPMTPNSRKRTSKRGIAVGVSGPNGAETAQPGPNPDKTRTKVGKKPEQRRFRDGVNDKNLCVGMVLIGAGRVSLC